MEKSGSVYAEVYLLDAPYAIDHAYDYYVPPQHVAAVRPGRFVTVPFGGGNRHRLAVVNGVKNTTAYDRVKPILSVCEEPLSLSDELLALSRMMKERLLCAFGDAVRAMIPSAAMARLKDYFVATDKAALTVKLTKNAAVEAFLTELRRRGEMSAEAAARALGEGAEKTLARLEKAGYLMRLTRTVQPETEKKRVFLAPFGTARAMQDILDGKTAPPDGKRALNDRQRAVLAALLTMEKPDAAALMAATGASAAQLRTLEGRGLIVRVEEALPRSGAPDTADGTVPPPICLNEEQSAAFVSLSALSRDGHPHGALLFGVTGSGKTSVMLSLMDDVLSRGKGVIVLLPEIALTPQSLAIFCGRYGERVAVLHSGLTAGERYEAYLRVRRGEARVVVGTRSAVFAPVENLGLIVIDEEQESTYKSDMDPKYHARDIARFRCAAQNALMLLASATPSLESYYKAQTGKYTLVKLKNRYGGAKLPEVVITDMRGEAGTGNLSPIGTALEGMIGENLSRGEQSILFLNRRGYHTHTVCKKCGEALRCPHCSVTLTYHTVKSRGGTGGQLVCHWCGYRAPMPQTCPNCGSEQLVREGYGTQRVEEELGVLYPSAHILRMDTDTTTERSAYDDILTAFRAHRADILLGTQMVTKGHDFPDVTLVGVLLADASLYLDDYRASERTFALLTQVIGRAGRASKPGRAVIQTNNPDSDVIRLACAQDYESFFGYEIRLRKLLSFPPFCDIALLTLSGEEEPFLLEAAGILAAHYRAILAEAGLTERQVAFGPFEAPVYRVDNRYRMRMVIKCVLNREMRGVFSRLLLEFGQKLGARSARISLTVDFNPSNL